MGFEPRYPFGHGGFQEHRRNLIKYENFLLEPDPIGRFLPGGKQILLLTGDGRAYGQSLDSDTPRPISPPGVLASYGVFTVDGSMCWGRTGRSTLFPVDCGKPVPLAK